MITEKKVFAEIGIRNDTFLSTEIEIWEDGEEKSESRTQGFIISKKIK